MCFKIKANSTKAKLNCTVTRGVKNAYMNEYGDLIFLMTDGAELNLGNVKNVMPVHFTEQDDGSYTADRTYEEICTAHDSGSYVFAVCGSTFANLVYKNNKGVMFTAVSMDPIQMGSDAYQMYVNSYLVASNDAVTVTMDNCSLLPPVDAEDEGKVMSVYGGAWGLMDVEGASGVCLVTFTEGEDGAYTTDKTYAEVAAAVEAGRFAVARFYLNEAEFFAPLSFYAGTLEYMTFEWSDVILPYDTWKNVYLFYFNAKGTVKRNTKNFGLLPYAGESENGYELRVVDGVWTAAKKVTETWTFTLEDGSVVTKEVCVV